MANPGQDRHLSRAVFIAERVAALELATCGYEAALTKPPPSGPGQEPFRAGRRGFHGEVLSPTQGEFGQLGAR